MRISFEAIPSTPDFFLDYIRDREEVGRFFGQGHSLESVARFAANCVSLAPERRERLAAILDEQQKRWGAGPGSGESLDKIRNGAVAVVTGQQAGLFTGPLYSILKGLTAVKLARSLEEAGIAAVPVFWIASDDHDQTEIGWAGILDRDSAFRRVRTVFEDGDATPAGWLRYPAAISETIDACLESLPESEFAGDVRTVVERAYRPGVSPVDAFGSMMADVFAGMPLLLVDPLDEGLWSLAGAVLAGALEQGPTIQTAVLDRTRRIEEAGYTPQVRVDPSFTGLFQMDGRSRIAVQPGDHPTSRLSPNVLVRPVVQDSLLPTAAYVGGPAEIAYMAQAGAIYDVLGVSMPPVFPRIGATLIEPPVARVLKKYHLAPTDVFDGDRLRERIVTSLHEGAVFDEVERGIEAQAERLRGVLTGVDKTLEGALDNSIQKMKHQIHSLQARFVSAETRRNEILERQLGLLSHRLFPERKLQERVVNVTSFLARYGMNLASLLDSALDLDGTVHQAVEL